MYGRDLSVRWPDQAGQNALEMRPHCLRLIQASVEPTKPFTAPQNQ